MKFQKMVPITELRRKIFHMLFGIVIIFLISYDFLDIWGLFFLFIIGCLLSFILVKYRIPLISDLLELFERKHVHPGKGVLTYMIGVLLSLKLFPIDIAYASILILAIGDGISPLVGMYFGKTKTFLSDQKLLEGTIIGIILGAVAASYYIPIFEAFLASFVAMTLEATEIKLNNKILSDNILVPLVAGTVVVLLRMYF